MTTILTDDDVFGTAPASPSPKSNILTDEDVFGPEAQSDPGIMGTIRDVGKGIGRGFNRLQQGGNILLEQTGLISEEDAAKAIARDEADVAQYPASKEVQQGQQEIATAGGWGATAYSILTNPRTLLSIVGESLPASTAVQIGGAIGGLTRSPTALMGGTGLASFATEYSSTILDEMRNSGVDINDPAQIEAALKDPEFMKRAGTRGVKRGIPIGAFDAISFGVAGRISKLIEGGAGVIGAARKVAGEAGEIATQGTLGGIGEAGGELADTGTLDPSNVLLEAGAEVFTGVPEILYGRTFGAKEGEIRAEPEQQPGAASPTATVPQGAAPAETLYGSDAEAEPSRVVSPPAVDPSIDRPNSPRLTPEDRASPLPNNLIDDGKAIIEDALAGRPLPTGEAIDLSGQTSTQTGSMRAVDEIGDRVAADPASEFSALPDHEVLTSAKPAAEPTPAQAEAGNYQKRHVTVNGLDVSIENEAGSMRRGVGPDGKPWEVTMPVPYGYVKRSTGADGENVDVYLGPKHSDTVYVVNQVDAKTGQFDEIKAILGTNSLDQALGIYTNAFSDGQGAARIGGVVEISANAFKELVRNGGGKTPLTGNEAGARPVSPSIVQDVARNVGQSSQPQQSRLSQLRREGGNRPPAIDELRGVPSGSRRAAVAPSPTGQEEQRRQLRAGQSSLGDEEGASSQSAQKPLVDGRRSNQTDSGMGGGEKSGSLNNLLSSRRGNDAAGSGNDASEDERPVDVRRRIVNRKTPLDIIEFVAALGGIKDATGELRAMDLHKKFVPGIGRLVRENGLDPDMVREAAGEAGYITPENANFTTTMRDLFDAMDRTARGDRVFKRSDMEHVEGGKVAKASEEDKAREAEWEAVRALGLSPDEEKQIGELVADGWWPSEAAAEVLGRDAAEEIGKPVEEYIDEEIPFEPGEAGAGTSREGEGRPAEGADKAPKEGGAAGGGKQAAQKGVENANPIVMGEVRQRTAAEKKADGDDRAWVAYARREKPFNSEKAYGNTREEAIANVRAKLGENAPEAPAPKPVANAGDEGGKVGRFGTVDEPNIEALGKAFGDYLVSPANRFNTIVQARSFAAEKLGGPIKAGTPAAKTIDEAIELGVVRAAREIVETGRRRQRTRTDIFNDLLGLYDRQPSLAVRTSTSIQNQAYSTPVPLAYVASRLAEIDKNSSVLEPTAGNGALLIEANPSNTTANELDPARAAALKTQGFDVSSKDATELSAPASDVVIANPPFGPVQENGKSKRFQVDARYSTTEIDHAIAMKALASMKDDGRAVLLLGGVNKLASSEEARSDAYNGKAKREFYYTLYNAYNVVDHFTVSGDLYQKQGAGWPIDVIVIRGKGKSARKLPAADVPRVLTTWDDVKGLLNAEYPETARPTGEPSEQPSGRDAEEPAGGRNVEPETEVSGGGPVAGGERDQGGRSAVVQPRPDERGALPEDQPAAGAGERGAGSEDAGADGGRADVEQAPAAKEPAPKKPQPKAEPDAKQVAYKPKSAGQGMGTLVPVNMLSTTQAALDTLADRVGPLDGFVAKELGYSQADLGKYFGAEQIDGIALAIDNFSKGAGFIVGDQTGIGKGRQVAAVLRWAMRNGKTPIFVTEKPNLYGDMYRDLTDIGVKNPRIFMTNSGENVPLNEEQTVSLKTPSAAIHNAVMNKMAAAGVLDERFDLVFTTYNQMQTIKGEPTARMAFLRAMASINGVLVLDESHNAGGTEAGGMIADDDKMTRARFVRELVGTANAVLYSSATYAKRPSVMDLYAKTDMRLAVDDISKLGDLIARGGVPMQQIVAAKLSQAGQYVRRERSFDGVVYDSPVVDVNKETYEGFSSSIKMIQTFSEDHVKAATKNIAKDVKADAKSISADGSTGGAGASSTNFTAIMHNVINQMLLSIKADTAVDFALEAIKRGEKPVITLANTLESFLDEYADTRGLRPGDALSLNFGELLQRYLARSRTVIIKKPFSKEPGTRHYLTDEELGPMGVRAYEEAKKQIAGTDFGKLPVSPIDWIKGRLAREGVKVGEITGRNMIIDYRADGAQILSMRPGAEKSIIGRRKSISDFNNGNLDVLILNQAGATGLSLHASEKVKDRRKRHMIIAQAEGNIDTHMQMLGRVHRTGQVVTPRYSQLVAGIPAEKRPASVLAKKMASLNANTTASRGGALTAKDVPDFMNEYGDQVAARIMNDNPDLHEAIGEPLEFGTGGYVVDGAMRKVTGRIPLLPLAQQEALYDMLESEYAAHIEQLEASGENALEAKTLPLDARTLEHRQVKEPVNADSPFADGVYFDKVDVKQLGKPMGSAEVLKAIGAELGEKIEPTKDAERDLDRLKAIGYRKANEAYQKVRGEFQAYRRELLDDLKSDEARKNQRTKLDDIQTRWNALTETLKPGVGVKLMTTNLGNLYGVVVSVERTGKTKNPMAMGAWKVKVALADSIRQITLPFSALYTARTAPTTPAASDIEIGTVNSIGSMPLIRAFDDMQQDRREERYIVTGNLLAGYDMLNARGQIMNYVDHEGVIKQGILLKRDFDPDAFLGTRPVKLVMSDHVMRFIEATKEPLYSTDRNAGVKMLPNGDVRIITDGTKAKGGQYFLNRNVLDAAGRDFVKAGGEMRIDVPPTTALRVLDAMKRAGATFEATSSLDVARQITGERGPMAALGERTPETTGAAPNTFRLKESFKVRAARIGPRMRAELDRIGLKDVGLRLADTLALNVDGKELPANGVYFQKLIQLALDQDEPTATLHHEALHALRDLGLFTKTEWAMLERMAKKVWMTRFDIADLYDAFPEWAQHEEAIAHAFAEWKAGRMTDGMIARLFKRIVAILRAIRTAITGEGMRSIDEVFEAIDRGVIGNRPRPGGAAGLEMGALRSETVETQDGKREQLVIPGAEKISDKQLAERRAEGPKKASAPQKGTEGLPLFDDGDRGQLKLFKLRRAPKGSAEAQEAMQGFIARGQPIDRAIRIPFDILGGIDQQGRWMPGKRLIDKLGPAGLSGGGLGGVVGAGIGTFVGGPVGTFVGGAAGGTVGAYLLGAKINVGERFPWLDGVLENFRRGLIDRYGLDPEYVDTDRKRALDQRAVLQQADGILKVLANSNVGPKEAAILQAILTGERVDDRDMALLAVPIRQAIDDLGAEAVSLGLISAESFERNRGAYLHRVYQKNEIEDKTLAGWVSRRMTSRRRRIIGDEMKGRGMFWDVSLDRLMRDVPGWKEAARGTPTEGEKFRVIDNVLSPTEDMLTGKERGKVARRVFLPADEMVPPKYTGPEWRDRGVWEVRGGKKGQITLWRDYTKSEREQMGEIVDARYTIAKTFMLLANDLSTGRFFKQVGENENWARSMPPPDGQWKTAEAYSRYWNDTQIGWVKVPDTVISGAGGRKRWGGLAGKYVRAEIWRDLNELDIAQNPGTWRKLYQQWKRNKTARNPVVHMNNIMSNLVFMDLADVRLQDLVAGIKAYHSGGKDFQEARDNGAFGADMMTQEIRDNVLKPILEEIAKQSAEGRATTPFLEKAGALGIFADKLWTWAKTADEGMLRAYQIEDELFRMATYMRRRQQGESPRVAALNAHDQFLNYDIRAPWIVAARNTVFPFISYTYRAVPKIAECLAHRPWKIAKYFALAYIANALAYAGDDGDDGEERERAALRDEEQGWTWIGVPRMVRMPFRDEHGLPVFLDIRRWIPAGDVFDTNQGSSAIPIPAPLQFGGPMVIAAEFLLNRQAFTGQDITNDLTDDNADKAENVADWAWKSWAPNALWVPNSWYWEKMRNAIVGATDAQGRQYSTAQAFLSSIGIKVRPLDVEDGLGWHAYDLKKVQQALKAELRAAGRKLDRGLISQAEYDREQAKVMEKFSNLELASKDLEERSQPKK